MANTFVTTKLVALKSLEILKNILLYRDLVYDERAKSLETDLGKKVGATVDVKLPASFNANDFTHGQTVTTQDVTITTVPVTLRYLSDVTVALSAIEENLELQDFTRDIIEPAMYALANKVDQRVVSHIFEAASKSILIASDTPTNLKDISEVGRYFDNAKAPSNDRHLVLSPDYKYRYALTDNLSKVSYAGENTVLRDAILGKIYGLNTYMSQNTPGSNASTSGTAKGTFKVESSAGGKVKITALSAATATVKAGDGFCYGNDIYRFTEDGTGTSSAIDSIAVSPAFPADKAAKEVRVVRGQSGVAFHKYAYTFVSKPLEKPMAQGTDCYVASADGLSVRVTKFYDIKTKTDMISFDILYGVDSLRPELSVVMQDNF